MDSQIYLFIIFAIITGTATKLITKYVLRETEPYALAVITNIISAIIFLIMAIPKFVLPSESAAWLILSVSSILWTLVSISVLISYKVAEVSIREPLSQSKIIIASILGFYLLGETISFNRIFGTLIIFFGISMLIFHPEKRFGRLSEPGVKWTFFAALVSAAAAVADKAALRWFNLETYAFLVYFFPLLILILFLRNRQSHIIHLLKTRGISSVITVIFSSLTYYFTLKSFSLGEVTLVYPLLQFTTLLAVIGGIVFMGEKEHFWQKMIAVVLVVIGSVFIKL